MSAAPYRFRTRWDLPVERGRLWEVVQDALAADDPLPWWGRVRVEGRDDSALHLVAESGLGYRLRFSIDQLELNRPDTMTFRAAGDLVGRAVLRFVPFGRHRTLLLIEWDVDVTRPWMRRTDPVLRPVFGAAHAMVMSQGERRFRRWLGDSSLGR